MRFSLPARRGSLVVKFADTYLKGHTVIGATRDQKLTLGPENIPLYHVPEFNNGMDWLPAVSGVDAVVHLAARVHQVIDQSEDPLSEYRRVNLDGTRRLR